MRTKIGIGLTAALLVAGVAAPAAAAPRTTAESDSASAALVAGTAFVTVDGFDWYDESGSGRHTAVEVFADGLECWQPSGPTFEFEVNRLAEARAWGTGTLECWNFATERPESAVVTADVSWVADGSATTTRGATPRSGCTHTTTTVPPRITGTVTVAVEGRDPFVATYEPSTYDRFAYSVSHCATRGTG